MWYFYDHNVKHFFLLYLLKYCAAWLYIFIFICNWSAIKINVIKKSQNARNVLTFPAGGTVDVVIILDRKTLNILALIFFSTVLW